MRIFSDRNFVIFVQILHVNLVLQIKTLACEMANTRSMCMKNSELARLDKTHNSSATVRMANVLRIINQQIVFKLLISIGSTAVVVRCEDA